MRLTKTLVVIGLLTVSSTAANASTLGWGSSWSNFSSANLSSRAQNQRGIASSVFNRLGTNLQPNQNANQTASATLSSIQSRMAVRDPVRTDTSASEVPLPASGLLLLGAVGALALRRRQKS